MLPGGMVYALGGVDVGVTWLSEIKAVVWGMWRGDEVYESWYWLDKFVILVLIRYICSLYWTFEIARSVGVKRKTDEQSNASMRQVHLIHLERIVGRTSESLYGSLRLFWVMKIVLIELGQRVHVTWILGCRSVWASTWWASNLFWMVLSSLQYCKSAEGVGVDGVERLIGCLVAQLSADG